MDSRTTIVQKCNRVLKYLSRISLIITLLLFVSTSIYYAQKYDYYIVDEVHYISASKLIIENFFPGKHWVWRYNIPKEYIHNNYLNLEHPPLGKYLIIISLLLLGDYPLAWRLPGIILGSLTIILIYYIGRELGEDIAALISVIAVLVDPMINSMSRIAMLDIYLTFFVTLAAYFIINKKDLILASIAAGLAISTKLNGIIILIILIFIIMLTDYCHIIRLEDVKDLLEISKLEFLKGISNALHAIYSFLLRLGEIILCMFIIAAIYLLINIPFIIKFGFMEWIDLQIWMVNVHAHFRASHPCEAPPISFKPPYLNWLFNIKPFILTYDFSACMNICISVLMLISSILFAILCLKKRKIIDIRILIIYLWIWLGYTFYIILYIIGRSMQFIYYMTPLMPAVHLSVGILPLLVVELIE